MDSSIERKLECCLNYFYFITSGDFLVTQSVAPSVVHGC
jgi:hypothetical protein